jgi:intraflagellar transport protein 20
LKVSFYFFRNYFDYIYVLELSSFNEKISDLIGVLESHATRIDAQKLQAMGLRMAVENETDQRHRQQKTLQGTINEKRAELDKLTAQLQSLERIEAEQTAQLEKMSIQN